MSALVELTLHTNTSIRQRGGIVAPLPQLLGSILELLSDGVREERRRGRKSTCINKDNGPRAPQELASGTCR